MNPKALLLLLALAVSSFATTRIDRIVPTSTQATINVVTDQAGNCTYRVSQSASLTPLVNDVNSSLFTGANSDARAGSIVDGKNHVFVSGLRTSTVALDGKLYSRALQAATTHYAGVTCGSDAEVTATFSTKNPPFGNSYPEAAPFNSAGFGNYAWPTIDFTDQSQGYIDPMTGLLLKRVTAPGWKGKDYQNNTFSIAVDVNAAWTNPNNVLTWPGSGSTVATYGGSSSSPLFVAADITAFTDYGFGALQSSGWTPLTSVDDVLVRAYGYGTATGTGQEINRTILVCLSLDSGRTCKTPEQAIILPPTTAAIGPTAPASGFPKAAWTSWSTTKPFVGHDFGTVLSTVTTIAGNTVTNTGTASAQMFNPNWGTGCKILVNGNETYTIAAVLNSTTLTTAETMTAHASPVSFKSECAGARIRKQTATGTVGVSLGYDLAASTEFQIPFTGVRNLCSQNTVTVSVDANGTAASPRSARLCAMPVSGNYGDAIFAFFPDNGETRLISNLQSSVGVQYHSPDWVAFDGNNTFNTFSGGDSWDPTNPTRMWTYMYFNYGAEAGHYALVRVDYTGDFRAYKPFSSTNGYVVSGAWPDDSLTFNIVGYPSASMGVDQQTIAFGNSNFNSAIYSSYSLAGILPGGVAVWSVGAAGGSESPGFFVLQNVSTGTVTSVIDTISTYPMRFWGNHTTQILGGQLVSIANILGNKGTDTGNYLGGFFTLYPTRVNKNNAWTVDTSLTSTYADACPGTIAAQWQALGAVGTNCVQVEAKQPCSSYAGATELANKPCPWDGTKSMLTTLAPGDRFWIGYPTGPETMRVVTTPVAAGTGIVQFWALRHSENFGGLGGSYSPGTSPSQANGWTAVMIPPEARSNATALISPTGTVLAESWTFSSTHSGIGSAPTPGAFTAVVAGADPVTGTPVYSSYGIRYNQTIAQQADQLPSYNLFADGHFGGLNNGGGAVESYISMMQRQAPASEKRWFLDLHHLNPSDGVRQEIAASVGAITASRVGQSNTYLFTSYPGVNTDIKHFPSMAYAGGNLLNDISGPASSISDSTPWSFCYVYVAGECVTGSTPGQAYVDVPGADMAGITSGQCIAGWYAQRNPCVIVPSAATGWALQFDASRNASDENYWRKLTQGFSGLGRQYQFGNINPDPSGQWAFMQCYWCDGTRNEVFAVQLPPMPALDTTTRSDFMNLPISVGAGPGTFARIRFGYAENGPVSSLFCSSRQESCVSDGVLAPFAYVQSDALNPTACAAGCQITIPAITGRILYYKVERLDVNGTVVASGRLSAISVDGQTTSQSSSVTFTMGSGQLSALAYNGQSMYYSGHSAPVVTGLTLTDSSGNNTAGSTTATTTTAGNTITKSYSWGSIATTYQAVANTLRIAAHVINSSSSTISQLAFFPLGITFPSTPVNPPGVALNSNHDSPSSMFFDYTTGVVDLVNEDVAGTLITGFRPNSSPIGQNWNIIMYFDPAQNFGNNPAAPRPIPPGGSDDYVISLRFAPEGTTEAQLAGDIFSAYGATFPAKIKASIQPPFAAMHNTTKLRPTCTTNPRGWFGDCSVDVTTPSGITAFQTRLLARADTAITECRRVGCQGFVNWDMDGQENDGTYLGDPTQYETIAPELVGVLDNYFAKFTNAGFKVGICVRPQIYTQVKGFASATGTTVTWSSGTQFDPNWSITGGDFVINGLHFSGNSGQPGSGGYVVSVNSPTSITLSASPGAVSNVPYLYAQHTNDPNPGANVKAKIQYAYNRWGATLFYIDSNSNFGTGVINPAADYAQYLNLFPGIMLFPELQNDRHYAYATPFTTTGQFVEPPASVLQVYPNAAVLAYIDDTYANTHPDRVLKSAQDGNFLLYDGWYRHAANDVIQGIYSQLLP